jgi:mannose-1-phosphate guanylyltransferase
MTTKKRDHRVHGIVLAGVHAWGEGALERVCSRPLLPVAGRPLIWYVLDWLRHRGVRRATICANSDTAAFRHCMGSGDSLGVSLDYYEDVMPRGPAGCMRDAAAGSEADTFVVADGTIVTQVDLDAVLRAHADQHADMTVVVSAADPARGLEPVGIYVVSRTVLEMISSKGYQDIKEMLVPALYRQGLRVVPYSAAEGSSLHVTGAVSYLAASAWAAEYACLRPEPWIGFCRVGEACIHDSAAVSPAACLLGPVLVGPDCTIEGGVTILGPTSIGAGSYVERDAVLRQTAIWSGCRIGAGAILDDSVVVDGSTVEPRMVLRSAIWAEGTADRPKRAGQPDSYWATASAGDKRILRAGATSHL